MASSGPVSNKEHVTFLLYWLCFFVFCCQSNEIPKYLLSLAQLLHEGTKVSLAKFFLANLYKGLTDVVRELHDTKSLSLAIGPFWLLQLWLNATLEERSIVAALSDVPDQIDGIRLSQLRFPGLTEAPQAAFEHYFSYFLKFHQHEDGLTPFAFRNKGPRWFKDIFDSPATPQTYCYYQAFCMPGMLQSDFKENELYFFLHQPSLVAHQLELSQLSPNLLFELMSNNLEAQDEGQEALRATVVSVEGHRPCLSSVIFDPSFHCSESFHSWWQ